ncbi:MAG TPA: PAS domain S-box protein [Burkholderiales bacterium]|jgi:PAS domain S-box-containing protein/diguanylate cyclase (GGDEF)-like protein|nr:PAS domain S-box protein [Burkholderiales bacterium]
MQDAVRLLMVEDVAADAELAVRELKRAGIRTRHRVVDSEKDFLEALKHFAPVLILSDFSLPGFDGMRALKIARERSPETPFIFVSGTIGEAYAIRALQNGATDYVLKSNLLRLPVAVERALRDARADGERRESRLALVASEAGLRRAQAMAGLAHVVTAKDGVIESFSESLPRMLGVSSSGIPGSARAWLELVHPEDRPRFRGAMLQAGHTGLRFELEYRIRHADGSWVRIKQVSEPLEASLGSAQQRWFGTLQDVTEHREAAAALAASEERYRSTFEQAAVGIVHTSLEGELRMANRVFCDLTGYSRAEAIQLQLRDVTHPEDFRRSVEGRGQLLQGTGKPYQRELRLVRKDGSLVWVNVTTSLVRDAAGAPHHFVSVLNDVTERRLAERELRRFQAAMNITVDSIYLTDPESMRFVYVNDTACRRLGYSREELLKKTSYDVVGKTPEEVAREYRAVIAAGERGMSSESRFVRKDGTEGWTELHRRALTIDGSVLVVTIGRDITERKRADQELRRFRLAMDGSADIILLIDRATMKHVDCNDTACRLLGYTREELLSLGPADTLPVSREELERSYDEMIRTQAPASGMNSYYRCKDGSTLPFESTRRLMRAGDSWLIVAISRDIRERLASENALRESEARFRSLTELSSDFYWETDAEHRILRVTHGPQHKPVAGTRQIGKRRWDLPSTRPDEAGWAAHRQVLEARQPFRDFEIARIDAKGVERFLSISGAPVFDEAGAFKGYRGVGKDITENKAQQKRIERLSRVYAVLSGINAAIVRISERAELFRETCRIAVSEGGFATARVIELDERGVARLAATTETDSRVFQEVLDEYNGDPAGANSLLAQALRGGKPVVSNDLVHDPRVHERTKLANEGTYALAILPLAVEQRTTGVIILRSGEAGIFDQEEMALLNELAGDVSFALENIAKTAKLNYLVLHDALTRLANRTLLAERLGQQIASAGPQGAKFALAALDLERLTTVNESLGRRAGDALLRQVGERLSRAAGASSVARIAADQFVAVLPTVKGRSQAGRAAAELARACFGAPYLLEDNDVRVAAKMGLALFPNDGTDAETLLANAEAALRKAKESGERQVFYTPDLTERTGVSLTLENKLRRALENDEFVLHYQPKIEVESRRIVGAEALIRWQSPELGLVPPGKFIPLMEETGMILDVGTWALKRAAADHRRWTEKGLRPPRVAVNVSAIQLRQKDFVGAVEQAILEGVAPTGIDLEITESLVMEDIEANISKLKEVRGLGLGIAIDDFGTGYSSLSYLAKLPVQILKIDRSFVITMLNEPDTMTLVQTIISLAHSLRLKVVAEGVDAEEQAKVLRLLRCDQMQGYLFSKPVPAEALIRLLEGGPVQPDPQPK